MSIFINGKEYKKPGKKLNIRTILKNKKMFKKLNIKKVNQSNFIKTFLEEKNKNGNR